MVREELGVTPSLFTMSWPDGRFKSRSAGLRLGKRKGLQRRWGQWPVSLQERGVIVTVAEAETWLSGAEGATFPRRCCCGVCGQYKQVEGEKSGAEQGQEAIGARLWSSVFKCRWVVLIERDRG